MTGRLNGKHIAITRPAGQATKLAELIQKQGGNPVLFPLIAIVPLDDYTQFDRQLDQLEKYDWAIFISSNAVNNAMPRLLKAFDGIPKTLQFAGIGPVTASELANFGVTDTLVPQHRFDSEALLALPEMQSVSNKNIVIFRGIGGRDVLADTLRERGANVDFAECYRRINPQADTNLLSALWQEHQLDALVMTSSEAMRHLLTLTDGGTAAWLQDIVLCVNHARIADQVKPDLKVAVAGAPGDDAMLQCLIKALAVHDD
jgi:uroporphyrinogen-III synthase